MISDIHEHVENLKKAIQRLQESRVDRIVMLGDAFKDGRRIVETCDLLSAVSRHGVWGNHDFGLCVDLGGDVRLGMDPSVMRYMATLKSHLVIGGCFLQHVEAWLNPESLDELWQHAGPSRSPARADRALRAVEQRVVIMGHLHEWVLFGEEGDTGWAGEGEIVLEPPSRYFLAVAAVCDGWAATLDTASGLLTPIKLV